MFCKHNGEMVQLVCSGEGSMPRSGLDMVCMSKYVICDVIASNDWLQQLVLMMELRTTRAQLWTHFLACLWWTLQHYIMLCLGCAFGS